MHVLTSVDKWGILFFREPQGILSSDESMAVQTSNESMDDSTTKPLHTKSLGSSKPVFGATKPDSGYVEPQHADHREKLKTKIGNKNKTRRGYGNKNKRNNRIKNINLSILGTNSAGLTSKKESLFSIVTLFKPSIITIQETKHTKNKNLKIPEYQNFERIRSGKSGGGLLTSITEDLNPILIHTANEDIELMTVEINVGEEKIRVINGYGPQEYDETNHIPT